MDGSNSDTEKLKHLEENLRNNPFRFQTIQQYGLKKKTTKNQKNMDPM